MKIQIKILFFLCTILYVADSASMQRSMFWLDDGRRLGHFAGARTLMIVGLTDVPQPQPQINEEVLKDPQFYEFTDLETLGKKLRGLTNTNYYQARKELIINAVNSGITPDDINKLPLSDTLWNAINHQDRDFVEFLFAMGANLRVITGNYVKLLVKTKNIEIIKLLIKYGGKDVLSNPHFFQLLDNNFSPELVRLYITNGADIGVDQNGYTPLTQCILQPNQCKKLFDIVRLLIYYGVPYDSKVRYGPSRLIGKNCLEILQDAIDQECNIEKECFYLQLKQVIEEAIIDRETAVQRSEQMHDIVPTLPSVTIALALSYLSIQK